MVFHDVAQARNTACESTNSGSDGLSYLSKNAPTGL